MAENITTTTDVSPAISEFYDRVLLLNARPKLIHALFADVKPLPAGSGGTIKFRRFGTLTTSTTPLAEGVMPTAQKLSITDLKATVAQYGTVVSLTDVVQLENADPLVTVATEELGADYGKTFDTVIRDILASTVSNTTINTAVSGTNLDAIIKTLKGADAEMFNPMIKASTGVGTTPVRASYWGLCHTDLEYDFDNISGYTTVSQYPNQKGVLDAEVGAYKNIRFCTSTNGYHSGDYYKIFVVGKHAYAYTELEGGTSKVIVKQLGSAGSKDALNQESTVGWKRSFVARILNDSYMHCLTCKSNS